jgi:hypothetical protein
MLVDDVAATVVRLVMEMGRSAGLEVVALGVATAEQVAALTALAAAPPKAGTSRRLGYGADLLACRASTSFDVVDARRFQVGSILASSRGPVTAIWPDRSASAHSICLVCHLASVMVVVWTTMSSG